jgi:hypothetical protein
MEMEELLRRLLEGVESCAEELVVLQQYALNVRIEHSPEGHGPRVVPLGDEQD